MDITDMRWGKLKRILLIMLLICPGKLNVTSGGEIMRTENYWRGLNSGARYKQFQALKQRHGGDLSYSDAQDIYNNYMSQYHKKETQELSAIPTEPAEVRVQYNAQPQQTIVPPARKTATNFKDRNLWVNALDLAYKKAGIENANMRNILIAQNALESGWGRKAVGDYNYGNVKDFSGKGRFAVDSVTKTNDAYKNYSSMDDYTKQTISMLKRLYEFDQNDSLNQFISKLQGGNKAGRFYAETSTPKGTREQKYNNYLRSVESTYNTLLRSRN